MRPMTAIPIRCQSSVVIRTRRGSSWLCKKFDLTEKDVIRHYDVTGKICPKYFVEDEDAWNQFRSDVKQALEKE